MDGVSGVNVTGVSPSEFDGICRAGEDVCILGGRSSSASTTSDLLDETLVAVDGGRTTDCCGNGPVFFRENHPDFFSLSPSRTTMRSSVKSGSYNIDKHTK